MKNYIKSISLAAGCLFATAMMHSCALDEPFANDGDGTLQMKLVINSDVTRAETDAADLSANCVVYVSGQNGLLHKFKGLENVPESINLKCGHYVAEAWTGDSVSASFDKKFYRGYQPFDVNAGVNNVVVNCKIANVVVSVNPATIDPSMIKDFNIKVANSRASLDFNEANYKTDKGYFMMPNADKDLKVTITGTNLEGKSFTKEHTIPSVQRAHEYVLNFNYNPEYSQEGGAYITITVDDREVLVEDEVEIFSRPAMAGVEFDADKQIIKPATGFTDKVLKVNAFGTITNYIVSTPDYGAFGLPEERFDFKHYTDEVKGQIEAAGLLRDETRNEERNVTTSFLTMTSAFLNRLPQRDEEYTLSIEVTDSYGKTTSQLIRLAVGEGAIVIDDPVTVEDAVNPDNLMAVLATKATLTGHLVSADAVNPGIRYREAGTTDWTFAAADASAANAARRRHFTPAQALRAGGTAFNVSLSGLKPGTRYEYQACAEGFNSESKFFTTEGKFILPNASMEDWSAYVDNSKVQMPSADGTKNFWDSGNHGSARMSKNITTGSTDMVHSGSKSAKLHSQFVGLGTIGKFAAGNIIVGEYYKTNGTNGELYLGREYNGSHPSKLKVYVNYRPGKVASDVAKKFFKAGDTDKGQIYVALTTEKVHIDTRYPDTSLWKTDAPCVLAYGEKIFSSNYGPDGQLEALEIPISYNATAKTTKPLYLVIVCTASYYGDYFEGGEGSVMYVDDFELVYE